MKGVYTERHAWNGTGNNFAPENSAQVSTQIMQHDHKIALQKDQTVIYVLYTAVVLAIQARIYPTKWSENNQLIG